MAARPEDIVRLPTAAAFEDVLAGAGTADVAVLARRLVAEGLDALPLPGSGETLRRWRCLEAVGRFDQALAKLFESHVDALAIASELEFDLSASDGALLAVWAAEGPKPVRFDGEGPRVALVGTKDWCSGARAVDVALVTVRDARDDRWLACVDLRRDGVSIDETRWQAVGMRDSATASVTFDRAPAILVGACGAYLSRPGFWHGGAGVAACWYGGAAEIGARVGVLQRGRRDVHALAHVGTIDHVLASAAALLRETAAAIDAAPRGDARHAALRARATVATACERVVSEAMRATGPGPFCEDARLARLAADLPVFVRQMRSEHDLVATAEALLETEAPQWRL